MVQGAEFLAYISQNITHKDSFKQKLGFDFEKLLNGEITLTNFNAERILRFMFGDDETQKSKYRNMKGFPLEREVEEVITEIEKDLNIPEGEGRKFAELVKAMRLVMGFVQDELGENSFMSDFENGKRTVTPRDARHITEKFGYKGVTKEFYETARGAENRLKERYDKFGDALFAVRVGETGTYKRPRIKLETLASNISEIYEKDESKRKQVASSITGISNIENKRTKYISDPTATSILSGVSKTLGLNHTMSDQELYEEGNRIKAINPQAIKNPLISSYAKSFLTRSAILAIGINISFHKGFKNFVLI